MACSPAEESRELLKVDDASTEEQDDFVQIPESRSGSGRSGRRVLAWVVGGVFVASAVFAVVFKGGYTGELSTESLGVESVVSFSEDKHKVHKKTCKKGPQEFESRTTAKADVKEAVGKAIMAIKAARKDCSLGPMSIVLHPESFLQGSVGHTHSVHAMHKFASDCESETFKLHFHIGKGAGTSFVAQVNHDLDSDSWKMLESNPPACQISTGSAAAPEYMPLKSKVVNAAADYAAIELTNQQRKKGCLPKDADGGYKATVKQAAAIVTAGLKFALKLEFTAGKGDPKLVILDVFQQCGKFGKCFFQLSVPPGKICDPFEGKAEHERLLSEMSQLGALPEDPTELMVAQGEMLEPRKLSSARNPLMERYIKTGSVPASHDPRSHPCFKKITVYNQGTCGSCYAQAFAQQAGLRKCLLDKKSRRLGDNEAAEEGEEPEDNGEAEATVSDEIDETEGTAELPEGPPEDVVPEEAEAVPEEPSATPRNLASCTDSTTWSAFGHGHYTCKKWATMDPGCKKYKDYGQQTHCRKVCGNCPTPSMIRNKGSTNPWAGAWYKYMPAVNEVAQCSKGGGHIFGCDGGNTQGIWNNWMRKENKKLWVMGASCMPYTFKCKDSSGVVNPMSGGQCSKYTNYQLWHKPCNCIASSHRPQGGYTCPNTRPSSGCGFPVPAAAFLVKHMGNGLSNRDAVLNMQRHIVEFGPLYLSFACTPAFQRWDWKTKPVYTGGGGKPGGHAVIAVGWGHGHGYDYWILRNSWAASWADGGYCKFRRGVNLDQIESRSVAVSMPTSNFKDWSAPVCNLRRWSMTYWSYGSTLTKYPFTFKIRCSKNAKLKVFISNKLAHRDDIYKSVSGNYVKGNGVGGQEVALKPIDMAPKGFGIVTGDSWISIEAEDASGNKEKTSTFVTVRATGKSKYSSRR